MKRKTLSRILSALFVIALLTISAVWLFNKMREAVIENQLPESVSTNESNNTSDRTAAENKDFFPFGHPSQAVSAPSSADNFLITGDYFSLSYNRSKGIANWVMWKLDKTSFGKIERQNDFRPDDRLPKNWRKVFPNDYSGSGYGRGHICPSADRTSSLEANSSTFMMSNITPQKNDLNTGPWDKLEKYSRSIARRSNILYIISGQYGEHGRIKNKITIPTNFWKIIVVIPEGKQIDKNSRIIAVDMPNVDGISGENWRSYRTTIRQIEKKTNYDFLSSLPEDIKNFLKSEIDTR